MAIILIITGIVLVVLRFRKYENRIRTLEKLALNQDVMNEHHTSFMENANEILKKHDYYLNR